MRPRCVSSPQRADPSARSATASGRVARRRSDKPPDAPNWQRTVIAFVACSMRLGLPQRCPSGVFLTLTDSCTLLVAPRDATALATLFSLSPIVPWATVRSRGDGCTAGRGTRLAFLHASGSALFVKGSMPMLWAIVAILVILWLLGFVAHIAGAFIHLLLVIAVIVLIVQLVSGRRRI